MEFNKFLEDVKSYEGGKPIELVVREFGIKEKDVIKLASNENPYGPSPKVYEAIEKNIKKINMYPDDSFLELKKLMSKKFDLQNENFIFGLGSDQIIDIAIRAKATIGSKVLTAGLTFAMYKIATQSVGATLIQTPSKEHNLKEFLELYDEHNPEIIFLCVPNNPIGECLDRDEIYDFISKVSSNTLVVVDGAYQEYAAYKDEKKKIDPKDLITKFPNTLYLGTFSKAYAIAGLRIGYGIARPDILKTFYKLRPPFNITNITLQAAIAALKDEEYTQECVRKSFEEMKRYENFANQKRFEYVPSYTNFIQFEFDKTKDSTEISDKLLKQGLIIRNMKSYGINGIRITIGSPEQNTIMLSALDKLL